MGFRRLSIIDITDSGDQPILNEDKSKVLFFNGEIYNYQDIRKELVEKGHIFTTNTDSEVLLHGYEEYGEKLLDRLRGMFAFVIWDKNTHELFGARAGCSARAICSASSPFTMQLWATHSCSAQR